MKLSERQRAALHALARCADWQNGYQLGARLDTLRSLERRGLAQCRYDTGAYLFPQTLLRWRLTGAGRQWLAEDGVPDPKEAEDLARDWPAMPEHLEGIDRFAEHPVSGLPDSTAE